jgi:hypothetical protein
MDITFNKRFQLLLEEYELPKDLSFHVDIPSEVKDILNDDISINELGITLKTNGLYTAREKWENRSIIEDSENHFHVDWYIEPPNNKQAFMLGIKTLVLLAQKFREQKISGIRFWYNFETPELGRQWAEAHHLHEDDDAYFISDRLSFLYQTRRRRYHYYQPG